jgi:hypothetical protein
MAQIDDFKANLIGGGARANQFRVTITPPSGIGTGLDVRRASFLARASSLPAQTLTEIAIPFRGRQIYIAGDRTFDEAWTTTFMNDTDFGIRQTDLQVEQLDRDNTILKTYIFRSAWPTSLAAIELSSDQADAIEEFEVTWRYQHFEASGVNF